MNVILTLNWLLAVALCVELGLPFRYYSDEIIVTRKNPIMKSNIMMDYGCTTLLFESRTYEPITRVLFAGVELFSNEEPVPWGFKRSVHHIKGRLREVIIVVRNYNGTSIEGVYFKNYDRLFNITHVEIILDGELKRRGKQFANRVTNHVYTKIPRVQILESNAPCHNTRGDPVITRRVEMQKKPSWRVVYEVDRIMQMMEIKKFTHEEVVAISRLR